MRKLLVIPIGLFILVVLGFLLGSAAQLPFILVISVMCLTPLFLLSLGFAFGKASNEYRFFVPKESTQTIQHQRSRRPASSYEVGVGEIRGN